MHAFFVSASERLFRGNRFGVLVVSFILFAMIGAAWSIATPIAGVPDEPAHVIKAAGVVRGELFGEYVYDENGGVHNSFNVPEAYAESSALTCNAFQPHIPIAACNTDHTEPPGTLVPAWSSAGEYNPLYYFVVGWPSLLTESLAGVTLMRIMSAVFGAIFWALAVWSLSFLRSRRLAVLVGIAAFVPSAQFYTGAVNPQGAEIATLAAFAAALFVAVRTRARGRLLFTLAIVMLVSGAVGAQMRNLAFVWIGAIVLIAIVLAGWRPFVQFIRRPVVLAAVVVVAAGIVVNALVILSRDSLTIPYPHWGEGWSFVNAFLYMLRGTASFFASIIATFGWMDITDEWAIYTYVTLAALLVASAFFIRMRARGRWAVFTALAAFVLLPAIIQGISMQQGGFIWQGRYALPLFVALLLVTGIVVGDHVHRWDRALMLRVGGFIVIALAVVQHTSFARALFRQYVGIEQPPLSVIRNPWAGAEFAQAPLFGTMGWMIAFALIATAWWFVARAVIAQPEPPLTDRQPGDARAADTLDSRV